MMQVYDGRIHRRQEEGMLQRESEEQFHAFSHEAYADGEVDGRTKILKGLLDPLPTQ
jgi:hypothetical protein